MIIEAEQFILLTCQMTHPVSPTVGDPVRPFMWLCQGVFSGQTEVVKWMMTSGVPYDHFRIIKTTLPLLDAPEHKVQDIEDLAQPAECVQLEDEPSER